MMNFKKTLLGLGVASLTPLTTTAQTCDNAGKGGNCVSAGCVWLGGGPGGGCVDPPSSSTTGEYRRMFLIEFIFAHVISNTFAWAICDCN